MVSKQSFNPIRPSWIAGIVFLVAFSSSSLAQGLNWEGQTGALITPFAYTSSSKEGLMGRPQASFHFIDTGDVIGGHIQTSVTVGFLNRGEFGYTRQIVSTGTTPALSRLFENGFNTIHGKLNALPENIAKQKWAPAVSFGWVARTQVRKVGGVLNGQDTNNGEFYTVATKIVPLAGGVSFLANVGFKVTNGSLFGIVGNASAWQGRWFGAGALVLAAGAAGSTVVVGSEFAQQPRLVAGLPGVIVPTTLVYFVRIVPVPKRLPLNLDFGVAQAAGTVAPGVNLKARAQFAMGASYQF